MKPRNWTLAAFLALMLLAAPAPPGATQEEEDVDPIVGTWHESESEVEVTEDGAGFTGIVTKVPDSSCTWEPGFRVFTVSHESATTYVGEHAWWELGGDCPFVGYGPSTMELSDGGATLSICNEFPARGWSECYTMHRDVDDSCPIPDSLGPASTGGTSRVSQPSEAECLEVTGVEVTQGIQNLKNQVSLVKGRRTFVRVHVRSSSGTVEDVDAQLKGRTVGASTKNLGTISPILTPDIVEQPDRASLFQSYLFRLPVAWTKGTGPAHVIAVRFKGIGHDFKCKDPVGGCVAYPSFHDEPIPDIVFLGVPWDEEKKGRTITHRPTAKDFKRAALELHSTMPVPNVRFWVRYIKPWIALDQPDDIGELARLMGMATLRRQLDGCPKGASPNCYFAAVVVGPAVNGTVGLANPAGNALGSYIDGNPFFTLSHEFAHALGRGHTKCPGMSSIRAPFDFYPYPDGLLSEDFTGEDAYFGTNVYARPYPWIFDPKKTHDLMSYCHPVWTSDYTWSGLKVGLESDFGKPVTGLSIAAAPEDAMVVSGVLFPDGTAEMNPILRATTEIDPPSASGDYAIEVRDASGSVLVTRALDPIADDQGSPAAFAVALPYEGAARSVALIHAGADVVSSESSPASPQVSITSPEGGGMLSASSTTLKWTASDADGDELTFAIQYSSDGGATWETLALDVQARSYEVALTDVPGSDQALFRVLASDGFNTAEDVTDATFSVPNHVPGLSVDGSTDYGVAIAGDIVFLDAFANDLEDGALEGDSVVWSSSLNGVLGEGTSLELDVSGLSPGLHELTVNATDSAGEMASYSFRLSVFASESEVPTCRGLAATHVGTNGPDVIRGTAGSDVIVGGPKADRLRGRGNDDYLCGRGGNDELVGGRGRDRLDGGRGRDTLKGGAGRDRCSGGQARDRFQSCERRKQ